MIWRVPIVSLQAFPLSYVKMPSIMSEFSLTPTLRFLGGACALLALASESASRAETYAPANFIEKAVQTYDPDLRLEPETEGTIELWLAVPAAPKEAWVTVARHGDADNGDNWQLSISGDRKSVKMQLGEEGSSLIIAPCDLTDGKFHHVACVNREGDLSFVVDGVKANPSTMTFGAGFAEPTWPGRTLAIGGAVKGAGFGGWIYTFRIWNKALSPAELNFTKGFYGLPVAAPRTADFTRFGKLTDSLVAYSHFTVDQQRLVFTQPEIDTTNLIGGTRGKRFFVPAGERWQVRRIECPPHYLRPLALSFRVYLTSVDNKIPLALPRMPGDGNPQLLALRREAAAAQASGSGEGMAKFAELVTRIEEMQTAAALHNPNPELRPANVPPPPSPPALGIKATSPLDLHVERVFGLYCGDVISDLALAHSGTKDFRTLIDFRNLATFHAHPFCETIPNAATFAGFVGRIDEQGSLAAIGLAWCFKPGRQEQTGIDAVRFGRWIDRDAPKQELDRTSFARRAEIISQQRSSAETREIVLGFINTLNQNLGDKKDPKLIDLIRPAATEARGVQDRYKKEEERHRQIGEANYRRRLDGAFTSALVYRFNYRRGVTATEDRLDLLVDDYCVDGDDAPLPMPGYYSSEPRCLTFRWVAANEWIWEPGRLGFNSEQDRQQAGERRLTITDRGVRLYGGSEMVPAPNVVQTLVPVVPYEKGNSKDKISWGGTFSFEQRPMLAKANFKGYNPLFMDPRNYQDSGTTKLIFKYPAETSSDYYFADGKMIIPHGLLYRNDNRGREGSNTQTLSSSSQYQSEWSASLGMNVSVPLTASFSMNASYGQQSSLMSGQKMTCTITRTRETRFALILDRTQMELDPEFRAQIEAMRDSLIATKTPDYSKFFQVYGTHYPHAVTYGGMAWLEMFLSENEYRDMFGSSASIHATASGGLPGVFSASANAGFDTKQSQTFAGMVGEQRAKFGVVGGSLSKNHGWNLPRGDEVPLLLDLRPIYELLGPANFDDPLITENLRQEMRGAYDHYVSRQATKP